MMSGDSPPSSGELGWTLSQRRALAGMLAGLLIVLSIRYAFNHTYVIDPQPAQGPRAGELASRLDPNSATWEELAAIPSLGEKRARQIVAFRESMRSQGPGEVIFHSSDDLLQVKGIGPATAENLRPYLIFPGERPGTRP